MASDRENLMPTFCRKPKAKSQKAELITEQYLPLCEEVTY